MLSLNIVKNSFKSIDLIVAGFNIISSNKALVQNVATEINIAKNSFKSVDLIVASFNTCTYQMKMKKSNLKL